MCENLLEMKGISKSYGGVKVLDNVDLDIRPGEIHALVGENGAGKSTLIKILSGNIKADTAEIRLEGKNVNIPNAWVAQTNGISTVHQELVQAPMLSIAENIYMGRLPKKLGVINKKKLCESTNELLESINLKFSPATRLGVLSLANRQMVEILKAISHDLKLIIFDEPTSSLTQEESDELFRIIRTLRQRNIAIIYISHRMNEVFDLSDRITVLRDGRKIGTVDTQDVSTDDVISMMVGRDLSNLFPKEEANIGEEVLRVENLSSDYVKDASFSLNKGEILGFGGLVGAGRTELMLSLIGKAPYTGDIYLDGVKTKINNARDAIRKNISYLTEDRKKLGIVGQFEIYKNTTLSTLRKHSNGIGILKKRQERATTIEYFNKLNIAATGINFRVKNLSGGNQQKVLISRCLSSTPNILILDEPTRGVDVGAKSEIYNIMSQLAKQGVSIIMISSELPELIAMSDRIVVMHEGRASGELQKDDINEINVMKYATRSE